MTSTTLNFKSNFGPAFFRVFKQRLADMIILAVISVFVPICAVIITFTNNITSSRGQIDISGALFAIVWVMTIVCGLFSLSIAPKMFKEIYKKQSCDFYFSMPIRREAYFAANYLYGLVLNVVAFVFSPSFFLIIMPMFSTKKLTFLYDATAADFFAVVIPIFLSVIVCYSAFVMCAVTAGKRFHYLIMSLICLFCTSSVISGIMVNLNSIWGLSVNTAFPLSIDPIQNAVQSTLLQGEKAVEISLISIFEIIGLFFAGLLVFKGRRAEVAEVSITGKVVPYILLANLTCAGFMNYSAIGNAFVAVAAGILIAVLLAMAFTGIMYKKVFTKQTGITVAAVCAVCTIFVCAVYFPSHNAFVKNVPETDEIESVEVSDYDSSEIYLSGILNIFNIDVPYESADKIKLTDEKSIGATVKLHQKLVDDTVIEKSQMFNNSTLFNYLFIDNYDYLYDTYSCRIVYTLKSGRRITRTYAVETKYITDEFTELMQNRSALEQLSHFDINSEDVLFSDIDTSYYLNEDWDVDYYDTYDKGSAIEDFDLGKFSDFKNLFIDDMLKMDKGNFIESFSDISYHGFYDSAVYPNSNRTVANLTVYYIKSDAPQEAKDKLHSLSTAAVRKGYQEFMYDDENSPFYYVEMADFYVYNNHTNTVKYLTEHGVKFE